MAGEWNRLTAVEVALAEQLRAWAPESGWGKLYVVITYEQGAPKLVTRIRGKSSVLLPGWSEQARRGSRPSHG